MKTNYLAKIDDLAIFLFILSNIFFIPFCNQYTIFIVYGTSSNYDFSLTGRDMEAITQNSGFNYEPNTFIGPNNRLWIVWCNSTGSDGEIWGSRSEPPYTNWQNSFRVTDDPNDDWEPFGLVDQNDIIWIFWQSNRLNSYDIWYKNSSDEGLTWSPDFFLMNTTSNERNPTALVDEANNIWIFYSTDVNGNSDIAYRRSVNSGQNWESEEIISLSSSVISEEVCDASIVQNETILLLVQELNSRWGTFIWELNYHDGNSWNRRQITPFDNSGRGTLIIKDENIIQIIYERNQRFFTRESPFIGRDQDWSAELLISNESVNNQNPSSFVDENSTLYLVWSSNQDGSWQIYLSIFPDIKSDNNNIFNLENLTKIANPILIGTFLILGIFSFAIISSNNTNKNEGSFNVTKDLSNIQKIGFSLLTLFGHILYPPKLRKIKENEVQENKTRELILLLLTEKKFMHFRELRRKTHIGAALLKWHLQVLEDFGYIKSFFHKPFLVYFLSQNKPDKMYLKVYFLLKSTVSYSLIQHLIKEGNWAIGKLTQLTNEPRKKVRYHLKKLHKSNLVIKEDNECYRLNPTYKDWVLEVMQEKPYDFLAEI